MKNIKISIACLVLLLAIVPMAQASTNPMVATIGTPSLVDSEKAEELTKRLEEINAMDKSGMNRTEKKQLRRDVKAINKELKSLDNGGVYLSVGAVIIIVLLLILLL